MWIMDASVGHNSYFPGQDNVLHSFNGSILILELSEIQWNLPITVCAETTFSCGIQTIYNTKFIRSTVELLHNYCNRLLLVPWSPYWSRRLEPSLTTINRFHCRWKLGFQALTILMYDCATSQTMYSRIYKVCHCYDNENN